MALLDSLPSDEANHLLYDWGLWGRDAQLPPSDEHDDWRTWLILAGRGFGKTRSGAEWIRAQVESGRYGRLALIGPTASDVRDVMVEGESGVLAIAPPWNRPTYVASKRRLIWPNGAIATTYSADEPERLRGPQHDGGWCDEIASWRRPEAWDMFQFGLRLGADPRAVVTTTPKPTRLIHTLVAAPTTAITRGNTFDNAANLAPAFIEQIIAKYQNTRLGRQEIYAEILDDNPGALWKRDTMIEALRVTHAPDLQRIVVAVDPAITASEGSDETGIIGAGVSSDAQGYVLEDASLRGTPLQWARAAVTLYYKLRADRIIAEANQGGDMVAQTIHTIDANVPVTLVHATRGKLTRAEPVAALYEQSRVHHVGAFPLLEDQMCQWTQGDASPDRLDALVWALTALLLDTHAPGIRWFQADDTSDEQTPEQPKLTPDEEQKQLEERQAELLNGYIRRMRGF